MIICRGLISINLLCLMLISEVIIVPSLSPSLSIGLLLHKQYHSFSLPFSDQLKCYCTSAPSLSLDCYMVNCCIVHRSPLSLSLFCFGWVVGSPRLMLPLIITASIGAELQRMAHDGAVVACPHHKFRCRNWHRCF